MNKFLTIFKREYTQVVKKKSFIIGIFLIPVMMGSFMILPALLVNKKSTSAEHLSIIDRSGINIGKEFAESLKQYKLEESGENYYEIQKVYNIAFENISEFNLVDSTLRNKIVEGELKYFLVINPDSHLADSNLYLVTNSQKFLTFNRFTRRLSNILATYRLELAQINIPVDSLLDMTAQINLTTQDVKGELVSFQDKFYTALIMIMIIYGMVFGYGQIVMRSIIEEKNSRIMEVLVSSVSPFQMMMGKIMGLCAATVTQVSVWIILGFFMFIMKGSIGISSGVSQILFNPAIPIFFTLFLVLGYILYSSMFALLGSIVNSDKEAQPYLFPMVMMLIVPIMISIYIIQEPNSLPVRIMSYIPFMIPTMMMMRIIVLAPSLTEVSLFSGIIGEGILSVIVLIISLIGMIWLTSKVFRVGILMYGKRPTLPEIIKWVRYK